MVSVVGDVSCSVDSFIATSLVWNASDSADLRQRNIERKRSGRVPQPHFMAIAKYVVELARSGRSRCKVFEPPVRVIHNRLLTCLKFVGSMPRDYSEGRTAIRY